MVCKRFYYNVVARVMLLLLTSLLFFFFVFHLPNLSLIIITACILVIQAVEMIRYINNINTKIEDIFLAYLSGEATTSFSPAMKRNEFGKMYSYFAQLNQNLENIRVDNEIRNNYFKTIVDQTAVGLISFSNDGHVEFMNDATKRMFKVHVVKNLSRLDAFKEEFGKFLLDIEAERTELVSVTIDGEMVQLSVKKVDFKAGPKSLHLVSLQNIKAELDQKEVESWQKLIRVLTHEIMNSITPITSVVNTLSRIFIMKDSGRIIGPEEVTEQSIERTVMGLAMVEKRGKGLVQFVNNYRDLTNLPKPNFQDIIIKPMFLDIQLLFQEQAEHRHISVVISCHPGLQIRMDRKLLEQVLINLFKNAIEASDESRKSTIKLSAYAANDHTFIEVEDNGTGIPPVVAENMFVPFFTTKEKGSGIGLSLSRQFVRLHGGNLDFYSVPGEKTVFTIKL